MAHENEIKLVALEEILPRSLQIDISLRLYHSCDASETLCERCLYPTESGESVRVTHINASNGMGPLYGFSELFRSYLHLIGPFVH